MQRSLGKLVEAIRQEHPGVVAKWLKTNADEHQGVKFHVVSVPVTEKTKDRDKVVQLIGEKLEVVLGIGPQAVYVAAGRDALKTLKQAIDRSEARGSQAVSPLEFSIDLGTVARFMAEVGKEKDKQNAQRALEKATGKDHVTLVATAIPRGLRFRLEVEEGALKMIGSMGKK